MMAWVEKKFLLVLTYAFIIRLDGDYSNLFLFIAID